MKQRKHWFYSLLLVALTVIVIILLLDQSSVNQDTFHGYLEENQFGNIHNIVTTVYLYFRVYDTFFEAVLLMVAIIGVFQFSYLGDHERQVDFQNFEHDSVKVFTLVRHILSIIYPIFVILGIYIIMNGADSPGGGFQGGAVLAVLFMSRYIVSERYLFPAEVPFKIEKGLFLVILLVIFVFLVLEVPYGQRRWFIIFMNVLIGFEVASGFTALFLKFVGRD